MSRVGAWQGSLRSNSSNNNVMNATTMNAVPVKEAARRGRGARSALGDISNRAGAGGAVAAGGKKLAKMDKPFTIEEDARPYSHDNSSSAQPASDAADASMPYSHGVRMFHPPAPKVDKADLNDLNNPKYAAEYVGDIYAHFKRVERKYLPDAGYMTTQTDINEKMRSLLIDWLIQVHIKFELLPQTLYLTVNVLDRFLERKVVQRRKLQLVGCAAMLVASKYEEIYAPETCDFVSMSDKAFTANDLLDMESVLLNVLGFHLTVPSPYTFLRRYMKVACSTAKTQHMATYLVERSLQEYAMLRHAPSRVAAAALHMAQGLTDERKTWGAVLVQHSGCEEEELQELVEEMKALYGACPKPYLQAVHKKYSGSRFMHVASIPLV